MMSLDEISDRFEIEALITDYCHAIDARDFDALDQIFTPDAFIDYSPTGGAKGSLGEIKLYLETALSKFATMQHFAGNTRLRLNGDTASGRTMLFNPMVIERDGEPHVFFVGAAYNDEFLRTGEGWRISRRVESLDYFHNVPDWFRPHTNDREGLGHD